jgi:MULE transposase domain
VNKCDPHNHAHDLSQVKRGLILKKIQVAVSADPTVPVRRQYDKVVAQDSSDSDETPLFSSIRSRCKRFRSAELPSIPRSIQDVVIPGEWKRTRKGKTFLRLLDNNIGIAVFSSRKMLSSLQKAKRLFIDGTFRTAPKPYNQFLTVHGEIGGFVVPLAFVLSTGKLTFQYRKIFQVLKREVTNLTNNDLKPDHIITDFENGLMTAITFEFPRSRLSGCYFHFNQSLWRGVQRFGLTTAYKQDRKLRKLIRRMMSIGFLPTLLVRQNFNLLRASRHTQVIIARHPRAGDWIAYIERNYVQRGSLFPPSVWNVYDRTCSTRTNNHAEG